MNTTVIDPEYGLFIALGNFCESEAFFLGPCLRSWWGREGNPWYYHLPTGGVSCCLWRGMWRVTEVSSPSNNLSVYPCWIWSVRNSSGVKEFYLVCPNHKQSSLVDTTITFQSHVGRAGSRRNRAQGRRTGLGQSWERWPVRGQSKATEFSL